jgi:hypothetical protein
VREAAVKRDGDDEGAGESWLPVCSDPNLVGFRAASTSCPLAQVKSKKNRSYSVCIESIAGCPHTGHVTLIELLSTR